MTDSSNQKNDNAAEEHHHFRDEIVLDKNLELPANRVIRKRIAARTIAVHLSALPPELQAFKNTTDNAYLTRYDLPDEINLTFSDGDSKVLSRDEAWEFADEAGSKLEWDILPDNMAGKATALFSSTGQGVYANYGRPTMDYSGFFHDYVSTSAGKRLGRSVLLGPVFIAMDTTSAIGFTALGHITRNARLTDKTVVSDVVSTGVYEGTTSWTSAKLGVFTGARAIHLTAALPIPGAHLAAFPVGFLVGAITAIFTKNFANQYKDSAIDAVHQSVMHSAAAEAGGTGVPA